MDSPVDDNRLISITAYTAQAAWTVVPRFPWYRSAPAKQMLQGSTAGLTTEDD